MGFEDLKEKVLKDAKKEEERILKDAKTQADLLKSQIVKEVSIYEEESDKKVNQKIKMMEVKILASSALEVKKKNLSIKESLIKESFDTAINKIDKKLTLPARKKLINNLLKKAEKEIEIGIVFCNAKDKKLIESKKLKEIDILGGVIVENKEGTVRIDYSFETLIDEIKEKNIAEINNILFDL
jgi:V/A-type H+/Na+-transporting ATPase subunit E